MNELKYHVAVRELQSGDYEMTYPRHFGGRALVLHKVLRPLGPSLIVLGAACDVIYTMAETVGSKAPDGAIEAGVLLIALGTALTLYAWRSKRRTLTIKPGQGIELPLGFVPFAKLASIAFGEDGADAVPRCWVTTLAGKRIPIAECASVEAANEVHTFLESNLGRA